MDSPENVLIERLQKAVLRRQELIEPAHTAAFRLFNGFYEGCPDLVVDLYGTTLVLFNYGENSPSSQLLLQTARDEILVMLPWIKCAITKHRSAEMDGLRKGIITFGSKPDAEIEEFGVKYALDLQMNQDASLYLDTRNLRKWLLEHSAGKEVLNTFAYTGSLGIAALYGRCSKLVQMDLSSKFMELSRKSAMLNHLDLGRMKLTAVDFFVGTGQLKRKGSLFDLVIIDPPFFSVTDRGKVDLVEETSRLINKVRPLVRDGGQIVAINNALFVSGENFMESLNQLGETGYVKVEEIIPVPEDITGYPDTIIGRPPADPSPFNHPTKIAVLNIKRKG